MLALVVCVAMVPACSSSDGQVAATSEPVPTTLVTTTTETPTTTTTAAETTTTTAPPPVSELALTMMRCDPAGFAEIGSGPVEMSEVNFEELPVLPPFADGSSADFGVLYRMECPQEKTTTDLQPLISPDGRWVVGEVYREDRLALLDLQGEQIYDIQADILNESGDFVTDVFLNPLGFGFDGQLRFTRGDDDRVYSYHPGFRKVGDVTDYTPQGSAEVLTVEVGDVYGNDIEFDRALVAPVRPDSPHWWPRGPVNINPVGDMAILPGGHVMVRPERTFADVADNAELPADQIANHDTLPELWIPRLAGVWLGDYRYATSVSDDGLDHLRFQSTGDDNVVVMDFDPETGRVTNWDYVFPPSDGGFSVMRPTPDRQDLLVGMYGTSPDSGQEFWQVDGDSLDFIRVEPSAPVWGYHSPWRRP